MYKKLILFLTLVFIGQSLEANKKLEDAIIESDLEKVEKIIEAIPSITSQEQYKYLSLAKETLNLRNLLLFKPEEYVAKIQSNSLANLLKISMGSFAVSAISQFAHIFDENYLLFKSRREQILTTISKISFLFGTSIFILLSCSSRIKSTELATIYQKNATKILAALADVPIREHNIAL